MPVAPVELAGRRHRSVNEATAASVFENYQHKQLRDLKIHRMFIRSIVYTGDQQAERSTLSCYGVLDGLWNIWQ